MNVEILKLLFDFGLLVLIWLVQRIIYPSFTYYQKNNLVKWHKEYTLRLGYIVIFLMIGQLILSVVWVFREFSLLRVINLGLIITIWLLTFLQFVPLHLKISSNMINDTILKQLVHLNWSRTLLWTLVFILSCIDMG
ncbi:hypothetical protein [Aquimarina sp. MMG016]|uniref:hypothetical protein n=1 Tax=Aquimarina sp. MMG016 TaxID=2822690 RepID=UPI001B3A4B5F|nr:hypothetical protein [Aquimarina sp. MMG016]MBQ4820413.1 hypothetical protein [Aquimarina sp. MMG016]